MDEKKIFALKIWLALGRLFGATQIGLLGTIFIVWLTGVLGQQGISTSNMVGSVMGAFITLVFSARLGIEIACKYPYWVVWLANISCIISGCIMLAGFDPWIILIVEATIAFMMDAGFLHMRKAMMHRKMYGDTLTKMNNQLDLISNMCYLLGSGLAIIVPATLEAVGITILVSASLLLPTNLMQIKVLVSMPNLEIKEPSE